MKCAASTMLLGLVILSCSACAALPEDPTPQLAIATPSPIPPTATVVWFPASETPTVQSLPTLGPTPERKPGVGRLLLTDDFVSASLWNPAVSEDAGIDIGRGRLTLAVQPGVNAFRIRQGPVLAAFYAEITARPSLCRDRDEYGLLFRAPNNVAFYSFALACNGTARLDRVRLGRLYPLQPAILSADVPAGAPGMVRIGVWASGPEMHFFLNGRYQFSATDNTLSSGSLGVFARSAAASPVTVTFSELSVYNVTYSPPTAVPTP